MRRGTRGMPRGRTPQRPSDGSNGWPRRGRRSGSRSRRGSGHDERHRATRRQRCHRHVRASTARRAQFGHAPTRARAPAPARRGGRRRSAPLARRCRARSAPRTAERPPHRSRTRAPGARSPRDPFRVHAGAWARHRPGRRAGPGSAVADGASAGAPRRGWRPHGVPRGCPRVRGWCGACGSWSERGMCRLPRDHRVIEPSPAPLPRLNADAASSAEPFAPHPASSLEP